MPAQSTYAYKARDVSGEVITGSLVAGSAQEVGARLRAEGKFILAVTENAMRAENQLDESAVRRNESAKRISREEVIGFCQQLSVMLETGVPLSEAMDAFCQQTANRDFRRVMEDLRDRIYAGDPFSKAMAEWPRVFPHMMISLMRASEASGTMSMMLGRVGEYLAKERRTTRQIKGAMSYPMFMMGIAVVMTTFLVAFILPRFASIYEMRSASLPMPTKSLLTASDFLITQYMYYLPALLAIAIGVHLWLRKPSGRRCMDWLRLNCPIIKRMYRQVYITRSARTMGTLLAAGVNLLDIVDICRGVTNNYYYDKLWDSVGDKVRDGKQFSDAIAESPLIPPSIVSMVASGERSGRLAEVMDTVAQFSDEELDVTVKQVTTYIEPIMIVVMGVMIGGVAMALLLPIFSMGRMMAGT